MAKDALVDYVIALETLVGEGKEGLRFRTSLLITELIGGSPDYRETVFSDVRRAYDLRSAVVHGDDGGDEARAVANRCSSFAAQHSASSSN